MKKWFFLLALVFLIGCGGSADKSETVQPKKTEPSNEHIQKGFEYLAKSDVLNAIRSFDEAIKSDPTNPTNYIVLGQVYLRLNNVEKALDTFNAATRVDPNNGDLFYILSFIYATQGQKDMAIEKIKKSIEIFVEERNQEKLLKSMALLQSLSGLKLEGGGQAEVPVQTPAQQQ